MSEDYLAQQQPTLTWNSARGVWEKAGMANLLCEHWELFSETWPTSGMMRNGQVFELPMQAHRTTDSESSSLPTLATPTTGETVGPSLSSSGGENLRTQVAILSGRDLPQRDPRLMPTPKARDSQAEGYEAGLRRATPQVGTIVKGLVEGDPRVIADDGLLRTPTASQGEGGALGEEEARKRGNTVGIRDQAMDLAQLNGAKVSRAERNLLGTPRTSSANASTNKQVEAGAPKARLEDQVHTNWGKFEPAIRRWEETLGRPAPAPTKPDGKDGAHRLSSAFTEWMMGVPEGWITGVGLSRNDELKACGNGVVPAQASLALRVLLEGITLPRGGGQVNLPTPTVSDTFTDNLKSSQQKDGSMHSVTLPQAVRWVAGE